MACSHARRQFLAGMLSGAAAAGLGREEQILASALKAGVKAKKLNEPGSLPTGKIGNLQISRLIMGGNLIGGWAHARDLIYVSRLFKAYNTEKKVFETLALAEEHGINTIQLDPRCLEVALKYRKECKGSIQLMFCVNLTHDSKKNRDQIKMLVDAGAVVLYTHGGITDRLVMDGKLDLIAEALEMIRREGLPAGIGSHALTVPKVCLQKGIVPDFFMKTFHSDRYWSATPPEYREEFCWQKGMSSDHNRYHDNIWCLNPEETAEFMRSVDKPWFAFKVMAAGALHPRIAFPYAYRNGADFIVAGMFDFQVAEDVKIAREALRRLDRRERPWCA